MNHTDIYIIGSAGSARDIANYILDIKSFSLKGFVDLDHQINSSHITIRDTQYPIIKESLFLTNQYHGNSVVIAVGIPEIRQKIARKYSANYQFPNIIHPTAQLFDTSIALGIGNIICPNSVITTNVRLGDFNYLNIGVTIGHDVSIGCYNVFNPKASISGNVEIGEYCMFGANSAVLQGLKIANNITLGIGSVFLRDALNNGVYIGNPARQIS